MQSEEQKIKVKEEAKGNLLYPLLEKVMQSEEQKNKAKSKIVNKK